MAYRYEVDEQNAVRIWNTDAPNGEDAPFIYQPDWPDTTPWGSREEAAAWAELFIESLTNPDAELLPGDSPAEPTKPRPLPEPEVTDGSN